MSLNTNSICEFCHGKVTNIEGRRYTIADLTRIHNEVCPGIRKVRTQ
jgi:hypothetical protein